MYSLASHTYFEEVGVVTSRMVTFASFPCAARIHYRPPTCFGERLAEENCAFNCHIA